MYIQINGTKEWDRAVKAVATFYKSLTSPAFRRGPHIDRCQATFRADGGSLEIVARVLGVQMSVFVAVAHSADDGDAEITTPLRHFDGDIFKDVGEIRIQSRVMMLRYDDERGATDVNAIGEDVDCGLLEHPTMPVVSVPADYLAAAMDFAAPAMSREETRVYLGGVYLSRRGYMAVATDGHRIAYYDDFTQTPTEGLFIPNNIVDVIVKIRKVYAKTGNNVVIAESDDYIGFEFAEWAITFERSPWKGKPMPVYGDGDWIRAVEHYTTDPATYCAAVNPQDLARAVPKVKGKKYVRVVVNYSDDLLTVEHDGTNRRATVTGRGTPGSFGLNARYLAEALASFGGAGSVHLTVYEKCIKLTDGRRSVTIMGRK